MDEDKVIRPMDFVRLTNIDESNVIKDTKNHIGLVKEVSRVILGYEDNCPLTGMCYDYYLLKPIIDYYDTWCTYPENFSLEDLIEKCYNIFFQGLA